MQKFSQFNLKKCKKIKISIGDLVKILDDNNNIIEYGYLIKDIYYEHGWPFVELKTQRNDRIIKMVLTDAIQKV